MFSEDEDEGGNDDFDMDDGNKGVNGDSNMDPDKALSYFIFLHQVHLP